MWWFVYLCACGVLYPLAGDRRARYCIAAFAAGLIVMQAWKVLGFEDWQWLASAATWAAVSVACRRQNVTFSTLTIFSALCYALGRAGGFDFAAYTLPIILADVFGVGALLFAGGPGVARMVGNMRRGGAMGGGVRRRDPVASRALAVEKAQAE